MRDALHLAGFEPQLPWSELVDLWTTAAAAPAHASERAVIDAMRKLRDLLEAAYAVCLFAMRPAVRQHGAYAPVLTWQPCGVLRDPDEPSERIAIREQWIAEQSYRADDSIRAVFAGAGAPRAHRHQELVAPSDWERSAQRDLMMRLHATDRLVAAIPLTSDVEVGMGFDREPPQSQFTERDKCLAVTGLRCIEPLLLREATLRGYVCGQPMTARERELTAALLTGDSEQEVAERVGLTRRAAHQRIVSIYRKLGVHTRAQLMACFLQSPARRPSD